MTSLVIEILVQHDFLNSLGVTGERKTIIAGVKHKPTMLSYAKSSPRTRIDDAAYVTTTPAKEETAQLTMSRSNETPTFRLLPRPSNSDDHNSSRTYHDQDELRDDTLAHQARTEWIAEQDRRFQVSGPPPPSPFQPQRVHHVASVDNRVLHRYQQHVGDHDWNAAQNAAQQAIRGQHPILRHAHSDTEVNPRYISSQYPVAQASHVRGGYVMQMHPRTSSFEQLRPQQANHVSLSPQVSSPIRRYEGHHRQHPSLLPPERSRVPPSYAATHASPQRRFVEAHPMRAETEWHSQRVTSYPPQMPTNQNAASSMGMARPTVTYQQQGRPWNAPSRPQATQKERVERNATSRTWNAPSHQKAIQKERVERNAISVAEINLAQFSSSAPPRELRDPNTIANDTKPTPMTIELKPSGHSDVSSSSSLGATSQSTEETAPTTEGAEGSTKRSAGASFAYPPVISEDSPQQNYQQEAPAKRMKPAYDPRSETTPSSLELLCSATLDLGPLQENATGCSCPRSSCVKLYCDCFKAGRRCSVKCSCTNCKNTPAESGYNGERTRAIRNILARNPRAFTGNKKEGVSRKPGDLVCNCVKSKCLKLYCECFQKGKLCNEACSCVSCLNTEEESHVGGRRKMAIQQALEKRPDAFTKKPKEIGSGCACKNNRCLKKYCDCFRFNLTCTERCSCRECENMAPAEGQATAVEQV